MRALGTFPKVSSPQKSSSILNNINNNNTFQRSPLHRKLSSIWHVVVIAYLNIYLNRVQPPTLHLYSGDWVGSTERNSKRGIFLFQGYEPLALMSNLQSSQTYAGRNTIKILKTRKVSFEQFLQLHLKQKTTEVESEEEIKDAFGVSVLSSWSSLLRSTWYFQLPSQASLWSRIFSN